MSTKTTWIQLLLANLFQTMKKCGGKDEVQITESVAKSTATIGVPIVKMSTKAADANSYKLLSSKKPTWYFQPFGPSTCKNFKQRYRCNNKHLFVINDDAKGY
jgi:hypothetical protein